MLLTMATGGVFYWTIGRMWERWNSVHGYYSHGPLIVPIAVGAAWLIVWRHGLPMQSTRGARVMGLVMLGGALLLHVASMYARVTFVSGFMICPFLAAIVLYLGGWPMLRRVWFPIAFLAFMVPLPDVAIGDINFRMKMFAANVAMGIVSGLGMPVYLRGAEIFLQGNQSLTVEDACSGLRSLISLLAFATLFTYACKLRGYKRLLLLLSAVPMALAANIVRIATLTLAAGMGHLQAASPGGWLHEVMGFVVFIIAFCCMFGFETLLLRLPERELATDSHRPPSPSRTGECSDPALRGGGDVNATMAALPWRTFQLLAIVAPAIALTALLVISGQRPMRVADFAGKAIPATFVTADRVWVSTSTKLSEFDMQMLETRDYVNRTYTDEGSGARGGGGIGGGVQLCVVFSEDNRKGTHPPDVCMSGAGHRILSRGERTVGEGREKVTLRELVVMVKEAGGGGESAGQYLYCAYFYKCGDGFTSSFYRQQVQIIWNGLTCRNAAGALIRYTTPMTNFSDLEAARARTDQLIALTFPYIRDNLR